MRACHLWEGSRQHGLLRFLQYLSVVKSLALRSPYQELEHLCGAWSTGAEKRLQAEALPEGDGTTAVARQCRRMGSSIDEAAALGLGGIARLAAHRGCSDKAAFASARSTRQISP
jgi:hypothetical protein